MGKKLTYANKLGIPYVMVCGADEKENSTVMLKNMKTGEQQSIKLDDFKAYLKI